MLLYSFTSERANAASINRIPDMADVIIDPDSVLENLSFPSSPLSTPAAVTPEHKIEVQKLQVEVEKPKVDIVATAEVDTTDDDDLTKLENFYEVDSLVLQGNPFFIDLVYSDDNTQFDWDMLQDFHTLIHGPKATIQDKIKPKELSSPEEMVAQLRKKTKLDIAKYSTHLFAFHQDQLPDPKSVEQIILTGKPVKKIKFDEEDYIYHKQKKLSLDGISGPLWCHKATAMGQFSGTMISDNWYQGGNSALAFLSVVNGKLIYDDRKLVQWENTGEWRMGFNWTDIQTGKVNDDVLKLNSKFGVKVKNDYFVTGSMDFSTQFFNSFKDNSSEKKTAFFSPVRFNMAVGLDYKYKKLISVLVSPVSYKFIYIDDPSVNPHQFGIETGNHVLSEIGSAIKVTNSYSPTKEIQFDSRFTMYTNYKKVEVDWELVCNLIVNRFISTRIMLNPRFDNTIISDNGKSPELQFKGLMSVGFMHKF
jgi:Protein of unknown function (DUF3078)